MSATDSSSRHHGAPASARADVVLSAGDIATYRQVVRDSGAGARGDHGGETPTTASPVQPFVLVQNAFHDFLTKMAAAVSVTSAAPDPTDSAASPRVVHLSQVVDQQRPLRAGERVTLQQGLTGARKDPRGVRLALRSVLTGEDGAPFAELATGLLLIGALAPEPFGDVPAHPSQPARAGDGDNGGGSDQRVTWTVPPELPPRYAEASGDHNPIHLDADQARAAGFPGVIAHGMSVVAHVCEVVIDRHAGGDAARVRSVGARFSSPVIPGEPLDVQLRPTGPAADGTTTVWFSCRVPGGIAVKHGWVGIVPDGQDR